LIPNNNTIEVWRPGLGISRSLIFLFFLTLFGISSVFAQSLNIVDVKVSGNKAAATELILSVANMKKGEQLNTSVTQDAIRRLYGLGFFKDITIDAEEVTGGVSLTIMVTELPKLSGLELRGNKAIKTKDLKEKLKLNIGTYLSASLIFDKKNEIINLYGEKGYFLVSVDQEIIYSADSSEVGLIYKINEGSKVKVEKVILTGNSQLLAKDIVGEMRNRKRGFLRSSNYDKDKYPEDKDKIIEYMHKKGYIDAYLKSDSMAIDTLRNRMTIFLDVYEGPRYYFGKTEWKGNEIFSVENLTRILKYKEGLVFDQEKYDESLYEIYFLYQEKGHLHIRVTDDRKTRDSLIDISFDIVEGTPSNVNLVKIIGNTKTKERVIRRETSIRPGQVFHRSLMIRSVRDIMQLNYFSNVEPDVTDLPTGDVDVILKVDEKPTGQVSAGAGYSEQDKFVGTFGLGIPNFRGMGQNLSFSVDIGSRLNSYTISFTEPWLFSTPTLMGIDLYSTNRRWYDEYTEGRRGGAIKFGRRLRWPDNYFRVYGRYQLEGDRFFNFDDDYLNSHRQLTTNYYVSPIDTSVTDTTYSYGIYYEGSLPSYHENWFSSSSMELSFVRDSRNLPEFATSGSIVSYAIEMTGGWLGGYWQYQKHSVELAKFIPLFGKVALAGKITGGAIYASAGDNKILESGRFSPGGTGYDGTVRGYEDGSLTPDTSAISISEYRYYWITDSVNYYAQAFDTTSYISKVRGKYMIVGNLELQVPIIENQLYTMLFFDMGNSWLHARDIKMRGFYKSVGVGFRIVVPGIGTIGFDFGYPLDNREDQNKSWRPHFQVGTTIR
jgi:outer membrane protein insertion porin family